MVDQLGAAGAGLFPLADFSGWMLAEQKRIYLLCQRMLCDPDEAGSATQDVFLKAYKALQERRDGIEEPARWLTRIAVNTCLDRLRSRRWQFWRKRPRPGDEEVILAMAPAHGPNAEDLAFARQIGARLAAAAARLPGRQRAVFALRHFENRPLDEIAGLLGLETGTVKAHLARAVAKMRTELVDLYAPRERERTGGTRHVEG
jgi:RNA polymerase sigma-70 factor (ECF subfamily)